MLLSWRFCPICLTTPNLGLMPNCCAAAWLLQLSVAKRNASVLNASSYLRRLSGVVLLFFAFITQEIYVLLLSA